MCTEQTALPCPFCGAEIDLSDEDVLYPTGAWKTHESGFRGYLRPNDPTREGLVWSIHCNVIYGGCSAEMSADSKEEVVQKWNRRA
jgi:hypothetical protein